MKLAWGLRRDLLSGWLSNQTPSAVCFSQHFSTTLLQYRENLQKIIAKITALFPFWTLFSLQCFGSYPDFHATSSIVACGRVNESPNYLTTCWLEQFVSVPLFQILFCLFFINLCLKMSSFACFCLCFLLNRDLSKDK